MRFILNNIISEIDILDSFDDLVYNNKIVIIDNKVHQLQKAILDPLIKNSSVYFFDANENNKTIDELENIYRFFQDHNVNRETIIIGIGGGITTDITAFAASTFKRGCRLQLIPTTFLAMVDAAIGGKTAVNFNGFKNAIGTFYPAERIYINLDFLKTLSNKDYISGWAECVKASLIKNNGLYEIISKDNATITTEVLLKTIEIKMALCENDLVDLGERRKLNLGHTFAHVIESASGYTINHGDAVAIGIRKAAEFSKNENLINKNDFVKINKLLDNFNLQKNIPIKIKNIIKKKGKKIILQDKKAGKKIRLVIFQGFQDVQVKEIEDSQKIVDLLI